MSYSFADSLRAGSGHHCCLYSEKLLMMDRGTVRNIRYMLAEFYFKNKFEKLMRLIAFIIGIYHDALSPKRQIPVVFSNFNIFNERMFRLLLLAY